MEKRVALERDEVDAARTELDNTFKPLSTERMNPVVGGPFALQI